MHNIKNVLFVTLKQWKGYEAIQNAMSAVFVRGGLHGGGGEEIVKVLITD